MHVLDRAEFLVRSAIWHLSAERISWLVCFPLMLWFAAQRMWIAVGCCSVLSVLVLTFRETIGNMRTTSLARARALKQNALDQQARELSLSMSSTGHADQRPYVLFLRPFSADRELHAKDSGSEHGFDVFPLETRLASGFEGRLATVSFSSSIGGRDVWGDAYASMPLDITPYHKEFHRYAGRLFYNRPGEITASEREWFDTFRHLSAHARLIVCVPLDAALSSSHSATIREIVDLRERNLLRRCVFVMPPEQSAWMMRPTDETEDRPGSGRTWSPRELRVSTLWDSTRSKLAEFGIALPEFEDTADGVKLFSLWEGECTMARVCARDLSNPRQYLKVLGMEAP